MATETCVVCGKVIPEGRQVCINCMKANGFPAETIKAAEELRDVADILSITANTDSNIQKALEAILRIADGLERNKDGRTVQTENRKSQT